MRRWNKYLIGAVAAEKLLFPFPVSFIQVCSSLQIQWMNLYCIAYVTECSRIWLHKNMQTFVLTMSNKSWVINYKPLQWKNPFHAFEIVSTFHILDIPSWKKNKNICMHSFENRCMMWDEGVTWKYYVITIYSNSFLQF